MSVYYIQFLINILAISPILCLKLYPALIKKTCQEQEKLKDPQDLKNQQNQKQEDELPKNK